MSEPSEILQRLVLGAYPKSFRRDFGDEMIRSMHDLRRHHAMHGWRLGFYVARDVVRTAPRMRMESLVTRANSRTTSRSLAAPVALVSLVAFAGMIMLGSFIIPVVLAVLLLVTVGRRHDRPIMADPAQSALWYRWVGAGVVCIGAGAGAAAMDADGELSTVTWSMMAFFGATGTVLVIFGLILAITHLVGRRST